MRLKRITNQRKNLQRYDIRVTYTPKRIFIAHRQTLYCTTKKRRLHNSLVLYYSSTLSHQETPLLFLGQVCSSRRTLTELTITPICSHIGNISFHWLIHPSFLYRLCSVGAKSHCNIIKNTLGDNKSSLQIDTKLHRPCRNRTPFFG